MVIITAVLLPSIIFDRETGIAINISPVFLSFSPTILSTIRFPNKNKGKNNKMAVITLLISCRGSASP